jgi:hypothetical protein
MRSVFRILDSIEYGSILLHIENGRISTLLPGVLQCTLKYAPSSRYACA